MFSGGYKIRDENGVHYLTFAVVEWIDVFTRKDYSDIFVIVLNIALRIRGCYCTDGL